MRVHILLITKISRLVRNVWVLQRLLLLLLEYNFYHFKLFFLNLSHHCKMLLIHSFVLMHHTASVLWLLRLWLVWNCSFAHCYRFNNCSHWGAAIPIVVFAARSVRAHYSIWTILFIDVAPIMIYTVFVATANFFYRRSSVPVMIITIWAIFANNFLVYWLFPHFIQIPNIFLFLFLRASACSYAVGKPLQLFYCWVFIFRLYSMIICKVSFCFPFRF